MSGEIVLILIIVAFACFVGGRWWAETMRAQRDMRQTWEKRKGYRK